MGDDTDVSPMDLGAAAPRSAVPVAMTQECMEQPSRWKRPRPVKQALSFRADHRHYAASRLHGLLQFARYGLPIAEFELRGRATEWRRFVSLRIQRQAKRESPPMGLA